MSRRIVFILFVMICGAGLAQAADWHEPEAEVRAVFTRPRGPEASVLVTLPYESSVEGRARAFDMRGREIPASVVYQSADEIAVLVRTGKRRLFTASQYYVYCGENLKPVPEELINRDFEPVTIAYYSNYGRSIPTSWERMRYMISKQKTPRHIVTEASMEDVRPPPSSWARGEHNHRRRRVPGGMLQMSAHMLIPASGVYRFHLNCNDAGFVMVDREIRAEWPGRHPRGGWRSGMPFYLEEGPHIIEVYGASAGLTRASVAVSKPKEGDKRVSLQDFVLISSATPESLRIEARKKTLHAGFDFDIGRPYKFRGMPQVFVPVSLKDFSSNDLPWPYTLNWRVLRGDALSEKDGSGSLRSVFHAGQHELSGKSALQVFDRLGLHSVALEIRDNLGFVSTLEREVDTRNLEAIEYAVNAVPVNVAPCLFSDDVVDPSIRIASKGSDSLKFLLEWRWRGKDGKRREGSRSISLSDRAKTFSMFSARARDIDSVEWELSHRGYRVDGGLMKFCSFPYASVPERVIEDRIYDSHGNQLFYVSSRSASSFRQPSIRAAHLKGGVLLFDDILSEDRPLAGKKVPLGGLLGQMLSLEQDSVSVKSLSSLAGYDHLGSAGLLLALSKSAASGRGVAVLSIGMDHYLAFDKPSDFERLVAAASDMLLSRRAMRTILVTMPPVQDDGESVREYAAAVRRVASARGVPVADLYTGFMGMSSNADTLEGGSPELTDEGIRLACQIIARTIVRGYRAEGQE